MDEAALVWLAIVVPSAGAAILTSASGTGLVEEGIHFRLGGGGESDMGAIAIGRVPAVIGRSNPEFRIGLSEGYRPRMLP